MVPRVGNSSDREVEVKALASMSPMSPMSTPPLVGEENSVAFTRRCDAYMVSIQYSKSQEGRAQLFRVPVIDSTCK